MDWKVATKLKYEATNSAKLDVLIFWISLRICLRIWPFLSLFLYAALNRYLLRGKLERITGNRLVDEFFLLDPHDGFWHW